MSEEIIAIRARHVSKSFRKYKNNMQKIQFLLLMRDAGIKVDVLEDISFDIKRGEKVGIIGRQQSGKTTLLRILAGIIRPDSGKVRTIGGLTSILDTRLGFDASMSGKDNYNTMTTYLGWDAATIKEHEDSIFEFARLSDEKDEPVRSYKRGCASRLGFAIATELKDDIILFDASLSFGSKVWNRMCMKRMKEFISGDTTFVMVVNKISDAAKLCNRGIVIHEGKLVFDGAYPDAVDYFRNNCKQISRKKGAEAIEDMSSDGLALEEPLEEDDSDDGSDM